MEVEPEYLSTEIIEGNIDVHPSKNAILIHYSVDARVLSERLETMGADLKQCRKTINIKGLSKSTDIQSLAGFLVSQTPLISSKRLPEIEQLLMYMLNRKLNKPGFQEEKDVLSQSSRGMCQELDACQREITEVASLVDLSDYLELLYEDIPEKVQGTGMILQLARNPDNLLELGSNESLFLALTRVLRDDWRKSIELSTNIIYIFFCFSTFSDFHSVLIHHKVGSLCMAVVEHEVNRHETLVEDAETKRKGARTTSSGKLEYEKAKKRLQTIEKRQDILLRVSLYLLYNLAELPAIEQKMKNKGIVSYLTRLLSRSNEELIILIVSFLKKLSIYGENKDEMAKEKILKRLLQLIPSTNEVLMNVAIHLLLNLSFDPSLREEMITLGYLPKLVAQLSNETHRLVVIFVLYLISMDDKGRSAFAYTDCVPAVMQLLLETEEPPDPEILALAINLACHPDNAALICHGPGLGLLMKKGLSTQDPLLMKVIRNVAQHPGEELKTLFLEFIGDLGNMIVNCQDEDYLVEVIGIMANIQLPDLDYNKILTELKMLPFIVKKLESASTKDDILLEIIILCGTFSSDPKCAVLFINEGLPQLLIDILKVKQDDDEIILQIGHTMYQWVLNPQTRDTMMKSEAPDYFIELLHDKNEDIHKIASEIVNVMTEHDAEFAERAKLVKFRFYNAQWLEMVTGKSLYIGGGGGVAGGPSLREVDDDDEDYNPFMDPYYLQMAAELYSPELLYENEALPHPIYTSPAGMEEPLGDYEQQGGGLFAYHSPAGAPVTTRPPSRLNF